MALSSRRTERQEQLLLMAANNFDDDSAIRHQIEDKKNYRKEEKDFLSLNKHRVQLISAGSKAFQQIQNQKERLPIKTTLTQMIYDTRVNTGQEKLVEELENKIEEE